MTKFIEWYKDKSRPIIAASLKQAKDELSNVEGLIDDVDVKREEIKDDILNNTFLEDKEIQRLDKRLNRIMME
jgi:hypothetical protein